MLKAKERKHDTAIDTTIVRHHRPHSAGRRPATGTPPARPPRPGRVRDVIASAEAGTGACGPGPVRGPAARRLPGGGPQSADDGGVEPRAPARRGRDVCWT